MFMLIMCLVQTCQRDLWRCTYKCNVNALTHNKIFFCSFKMFLLLRGYMAVKWLFFWLYWCYTQSGVCTWCLIFSKIYWLLCITGNATLPFLVVKLLVVSSPCHLPLCMPASVFGPSRVQGPWGHMCMYVCVCVCVYIYDTRTQSLALTFPLSTKFCWWHNVHSNVKDQ